MSETQFEIDPFLKLLTDALRAGPGSPQWHEAVARLREGNASADMDDYRLLVRAREDLESGREYRGVRAGPDFTRKVMQGIDEEHQRAGKGLQSTTLITLLAAAGIAGVVVFLAVVLMRGGQEPTAQDLAATPFTSSAITSELSQGIPAEWRAFGVEPVVSEMNRGLRGASAAKSEDYQIGGIVSAISYAPAQALAIEASVRMEKPSTKAILRLFVAEDAVPSAATTSAAAPGRELVAELVAEVNNGAVTAFKPDGSLAGEPVKVPSDEEHVIHVTIKMDRRFAVVEVDGRQVFVGEHGLSPEKPRWPGLRFLTRGSAFDADDVLVQSIRILKP